MPVSSSSARPQMATMWPTGCRHHPASASTADAAREHDTLSYTYRSWSQNCSQYGTLNSNGQLMRGSRNRSTTSVLRKSLQIPSNTRACLGSPRGLPWPLRAPGSLRLAHNQRKPLPLCLFLISSPKPSIFLTTGNH